MENNYKPKYQQSHSIKDYDEIENEALREHLIKKEHRRQKYEARYEKRKDEGLEGKL